jgi:hypothetical protein
MANLIEGTKRANVYLRSLGHKSEFHDGASIANIVYGYDPNRHLETCLKEVRNYVHKAASFRLSEDQVSELVWATQAGL